MYSQIFFRGMQNFLQGSLYLLEHESGYSNKPRETINSTNITNSLIDKLFFLSINTYVGRQHEVIHKIKFRESKNRASSIKKRKNQQWPYKWRSQVDDWANLSFSFWKELAQIKKSYLKLLGWPPPLYQNSGYAIGPFTNESSNSHPKIQIHVYFHHR